jgi:dTDP-4-dehydrorhamnose 3,5-epimerase
MALEEPRIIDPRIFADDRGFFSEVYHKRRFDAEVGPTEFVQDNHSLSRRVGTVRGLHFQTGPAAQGKLVRVIRGAIFDVAVDCRRGSPSFGRHWSATLDTTNRRQFWVPVGFAHGFCTLEPDTEVEYKVTSFYSAEHDGGIFWADPALGIDWPISLEDAVVSDKDQRLPRLGTIDAPFAAHAGAGA